MMKQKEIHFSINDTSIVLSEKKLTAFLDQFNDTYRTSFMVPALARGFKLRNEAHELVRMTIFNEFPEHGIDFWSISHKLGIPVSTIRNQIKLILAWNIYKLSDETINRTVQKKLSFNSLGRSIYLAARILHPKNFQKAKKQQQVFKFISQYYENSYYETISAERYQQLHQQLEKISENCIYFEPDLEKQRLFVQIASSQDSEKYLIRGCISQPNSLQQQKKEEEFGQQVHKQRKCHLHNFSDERYLCWMSEKAFYQQSIDELRSRRPTCDSLANIILMYQLKIFCFKYLLGELMGYDI